LSCNKTKATFQRVSFFSIFTLRSYTKCRYPFGSLVPNRHGSTADYRYGFQGQEKDDEIKGEGNSLNYTFRMHDPRVGRFFALDPLKAKFAWNSPYAFSSNNVIHGVELEGLEVSPYMEKNKYKPVFVEGSGSVIKRIDNAAGNTIGFVGNITIVPAYNLCSGFINGGYNLFTGKYNNTISYLPTEIDRGLNTFSNQVEDYFANLGDYFTNNSGEKIFNDSVDSFTVLENYELLGEIFVWHKASSKFGSGGGMASVTTAETESLIKVDLMSGPKGRSGFVTFDIVEGADISDDVVNFGKHFKKGTIDIMEVNNPQASFMQHVEESIKSGGTMTIRGTMSNKYFNKIFNNAEGLESFNVVKKTTDVKNAGYQRTDGAAVQGQINEIVLQKK
jgi:RHS repeat-associated protein